MSFPDLAQKSYFCFYNTKDKMVSMVFALWLEVVASDGYVDKYSLLTLFCN